MADNNDLQYRLYLSQGEENIYIDNCKIPTHHMEGIRFIYRQFKKKRLGVIMNDPYGNSRYIQIVLFLKAIRSLLKKPVLILCPEEAENEWMHQFFTWTDYDDEIAVGTTTPITQKLIIINTMLNMPIYCDKEWSIIIVDGDKNNSTNQLLKMSFKADFKIWSTTVNMKKHLYKFAEIYKWMYPKEAFDVLNFFPNKDNPIDVWKKSILLDAFIEDIVIRREDISTSFEKYHRDFIMPAPKPATATDINKNVSRKNKDATGTKIKRLKTVVNVTEQRNEPSVTNVTKEGTGPGVTHETPPVTNITVEGTRPATVTDTNKSIKNKDATGTKIKRLKTKADDVNVTEERNKSSVTNVTREETRPAITHAALATILASILGESSKTSELKNKDNGAIIEKEKESQCDIVQIDDSDTQGARQLYYKPENLTQNAGDKPEEIDTQPHRKATLLSKKHSVEEPNKAFSSSTSNDQDNNFISDEILNDKPGNDQTIDELNPENQSETCISSQFMNIIPLPPDRVEKDLTNEKTNVNTEQLNKEISDVGTDTINKKGQKLKTETKNVSDEATKNSMEMVKNVAEKHGDNVTTPIELDDDMNSEQVSSLKRNTDNIDDKMKEYEEKLRKKFKGSFLDNLF